jgi:hypothetical protein
MYLDKYVPDLIEAMVAFIMSIFTKPVIFLKWIKKIVSEGLKETLDAKKFSIANDE